MDLNEILLSGGGVCLILLTMIEVAPIKINPWSWLVQTVGRAINGEVLKEVREVRKDLNDHIRVDDEREADHYRERILKFNMELVRGFRHTREDWVDILATIDAYELYCEEHKEYKNSRAVHAITNIEKLYDERLDKNDFA